MRNCRINLPNRRYHFIGRVAHRAFEFEGLQAANRKGRYDKEKLLWQFIVAISSDPSSSPFCQMMDVPAAKFARCKIAR
jgi:hypothetical protein